MNRSSNRILTTHVGSLIRPAALQDFLRAKQAGKPYDEKAYQACLTVLGRRGGAPAGGCRHRRGERR